MHRACEQGRASIEVHLGQPVDVEGIRSLGPAWFGGLLDGELQFAGSVDVGRVRRPVEDNPAAFDVCSAISHVPRLAVHDHLLINRAAVLDFQRVPIDDQRLLSLFLNLRQMDVTLRENVRDLGRRIPFGTIHAHVNLVRLHHVGLC